MSDAEVVQAVLRQSVKALGYYTALIIVMRFAGKRLAGQTTTFDLIVLITLGVVIQTTALDEGAVNAVVFVATVFIVHKVLALLCARYTIVRHLVRGKPRVLLRQGRILRDGLDREGMSEAELLAGLRKLGYESPEQVKLAVLEETGHVSAVGDHERRHGTANAGSGVRPEP